MLRNYEVVSPFIAATNDAFNRLKPGFEAPVCTVASVGHNVEIPSRNRTVLVGLIRDTNNPMSTRFEVRSSNPATNTYLALASIYQTMLDGIKAAVKSQKATKQLETDFFKKEGEEKFYLRKDRSYRSEKDVFKHYTSEERNKKFGVPPATVWENIKGFDLELRKNEILYAGDVFSEDIIDSYKEATLTRWVTELLGRIIPDNIELVRDCKKIHNKGDSTDIDEINWENINELRKYLMKDTLKKKSLFTRMGECIESGNLELVSELQLEMNEKITLLKQLYTTYLKNLFEQRE